MLVWILQSKDIKPDEFWKGEWDEFGKGGFICEDQTWKEGDSKQ